MIEAVYGAAFMVLVGYGLHLLWLAAGFIKYGRSDTGDIDTDDNPFEINGVTPIVTVQLPLYNEPQVAERLIDACARLEYPREKLEIQVVDDSTDVTVELVERRVRYWTEAGVNIKHVRRSSRNGFKAGALRHALTVAQGEFIAIFDADFLPPRDFLRKVLPTFRDPSTGMTQTRWDFLNRDRSLLTRIQALGLDAHFAVEQFVRNRTGCFMHFNGTAGVWRRRCIEDAGGWQADTLTEDLDLSYRAQLAGWRFVYLRRAEAPSELPAVMSDLREQQFRWTKGGIQTARKTIGRLIREGPDLKTRIEGVIHLTSHLVFPVLFIAGLLHAPLAYMDDGSIAAHPSLVLSILGLVAVGGVFVVQLLAQRSLHSDWHRRIALFPLFLAGTMGLAISNTLAIADAFSGKPMNFVRTPKTGSLEDRFDRRTWVAGGGSAASRLLPPVVILEVAMAIYCLAGLVLLALSGIWSALPFQLFLTAGFLLVSLVNLKQSLERRGGD